MSFDPKEHPRKPNGQFDTKDAPPDAPDAAYAGDGMEDVQGLVRELGLVNPREVTLMHGGEPTVFEAYDLPDGRLGEDLDDTLSMAAEDSGRVILLDPTPDDDGPVNLWDDGGSQLLRYPGFEPKPEPTPVAEPVVEPVVEPVAEPEPEPTREPASEPTPSRNTRTYDPTTLSPDLDKYRTLPPTDLSHLDHEAVNPGYDAEAAWELNDFQRCNGRKPRAVELAMWIETGKLATFEQWQHYVLHKGTRLPKDVMRRAYNPYGYNCPMVAAAAELRCRGYDVTAAPAAYDNATTCPPYIAMNWRDKYGNVRKFTPAATRWEMERTLEKYPVGARFFVNCDQKGGNGHIWMAQVEDDGHGGRRVHEYEYQTGSAQGRYDARVKAARNVSPGFTPTGIERPEYTDPLRHLKGEREENWEWMRVDDLHPTDRLLHPDPRLSGLSNTPWVVPSGKQPPRVDRTPPKSRPSKAKVNPDKLHDAKLLLFSDSKDYSQWGWETPAPDGTMKG